MHTYSLAFTPVFHHQLLFAVGCLLLKFKRSVLRRTIKAKPYHLAFAMSLAFAGLLGNILRAPTSMAYFVIYVG